MAYDPRLVAFSWKILYKFIQSCTHVPVEGDPLGSTVNQDRVISSYQLGAKLAEILRSSQSC